MTTHQIALSTGTIDYQDSGGDGPPIVLLHGLLMNATLWQGVTRELSARWRCVVPTLPLGAHRHPMRRDADLSLPGIARLVTELLDALDLRGITLVGNDTGGALAQLIATTEPARIGRLVLVSCEAFDNFPPGLTGKTLLASGRLSPALFAAFLRQMRLRPMRRLPIAFGWLTKRGDATTAGWINPVLEDREIARDTVRMLRAARAEPDLLVGVASRLPRFDRPALVVWASQDRVMPVEHGRRLAELLPHAGLVEIDDSYTLVPLDQPTALARAIEEFLTASARAATDQENPGARPTPGR